MEFILKRELDAMFTSKKPFFVNFKAIDTVNPVWEAQILSQLKLTNNHVGFLVNFNVTRIKDGIRRFSVE